MKLLIAIVQDEDLYGLRDDLTKEGFRITKLSSTGGFLKSGNSTLIIGTEDDLVDKCLSIIKSDCKARTATQSVTNANMPGATYMSAPVDVMVGGATIFIVDVYKYYKF
ncbi:MAG: cyclic-di-AMP receptor [Finegoldia sp.]|nr:cyclic-di-AMP receptor [Finegoldia sp.]